jgi:hypothetical protein
MYPSGGLKSSQSSQIRNIRGAEAAPTTVGMPTLNVDTPPPVKGPAGGSPSRAYAVDAPATLKKKKKLKKSSQKKETTRVTKNYNNATTMRRGLF